MFKVLVSGAGLVLGSIPWQVIFTVSLSSVAPTWNGTKAARPE